MHHILVHPRKPYTWPSMTMTWRNPSMVVSVFKAIVNKLQLSGVVIILSDSCVIKHLGTEVCYF